MLNLDFFHLHPVFILLCSSHLLKKGRQIVEILRGPYKTTNIGASGITASQDELIEKLKKFTIALLLLLRRNMRAPQFENVSY